MIANKINPLYKDDRKEFEDSESLSSGDSVLIGIEDQPEFKNYKERYDEETEDSSSGDDSVNSESYNRKRSFVIQPPPFNLGNGAPKGNPLFIEDESEL